MAVSHNAGKVRTRYRRASARQETPEALRDAELIPHEPLDDQFEEGLPWGYNSFPSRVRF